MQTLTMIYKLTKDINNKYYIIEIIKSKNANKILKHTIIFYNFFFIFPLSKFLRFHCIKILFCLLLMNYVKLSFLS